MSVEVVPGVQITAAILCEEVRSELNGKSTLLGVYSGDLLVPELPANLRLGVYAEATASLAYKGPLHVRFLLNGEQIVLGNGTLNTEAGYIALPVSGMIVGCNKPGIVSVEFSPDATLWKEVISRQLKIGTFKDGILISPSV